MLLFSDEGVFSEGLSVLGLVFLDVLDLGSELLSSGDQEVGDDVVSSVDIDFGILDVLVEFDDETVVLVGSGLEVEFQLFKGVVKVANEFLNCFQELLDGALCHRVELNQVEEG